jgi:hypothetical protein
MSDMIAACEAAAHAGGLASGLALALAEAGVPAPPGPVAALPTSSVPAAARVVPHRLAEREGVSFVRWPLTPDGTDDPDDTYDPENTYDADSAHGGYAPNDAYAPDAADRADGPDGADAGAHRLAALLGAVRAGLARRLLDDAVAHLSGRVAEGEPISRKQMVRGTVADVHTGLEAVLRLLRVAGDVPAAVADAHDRITALDWEAAKLLGASGFVADGAARPGYVGWLVAQTWLPADGMPAARHAPKPSPRDRSGSGSGRERPRPAALRAVASPANEEVRTS